MRVWAVSDIHTDYPDNMAWLQQLSSGSSGEYRQDAILVAGDVSDSWETLTKTLELLTSAFGHVFFIPGNHDLWVRRHERGQYDSLEKLRRLQALCKRLGVHMEPACVGGVWIVPIFSWYHASWDREPDVPGSTPINKVMLDFHACSWESQPGVQAGEESLARHFDELNEPAFSVALRQIEEQAAAAGGVRPPVISFSHFLPRQELLPEKRMLYYPNLAKAAGSDFLEKRIRRLHPLAHCFGHTHFSWDAEIDGVRYIQWPLGYPQEHRRRRDGGAGWLPLPLYDTERCSAGSGSKNSNSNSSSGSGGSNPASGLAPPRDCYWSTFYSMHPRDPQNITAAPWVAG